MFKKEGRGKGEGKGKKKRNEKKMGVTQQKSLGCKKFGDYLLNAFFVI